MESPSPVPLDLHKEYFRALAALRLAASAVIVFAAWGLYKASLMAGSSLDVFENLVSGGVAALPSLTQLVTKNWLLFAAPAALGSFAGLAGVWMPRCRIPGVIYFCLAGTVPALLACILFHHTVYDALATVITRFNG